MNAPPEERSSVLRAASYLRVAHGELDLSAALAREAIEIASAVGCYWVHAYALLALGFRAQAAGEMDEEASCYEEGLAVARNVPAPLPFQVSTLLQCLAEVAFRAGDLDRAESLCLEALAVLEPFGERYGAGFILRTLGWVRHHKGDTVGALDAWFKAFQASREVDDRKSVV